LGYINPEKALRVHVDDEDKGVNEMGTPGGTQKVTFINESGLYSLILSSKLPQAKAFKRWVTSEVLPQIRKTGGYIPTKDNEGHELSAEEILERANAIVGRTLLMLNAPNDNCLTATQVATDWGMNVRSFNALLRMMGVQYRRGGRWHLSQELQGLGYAEDRHYFSYSLKGSPRQTTYLVWTPKGVRFLNSYVHNMPLLIQPKSIQLSIEF
jgi:prophage antirepressor-like protein